MVLILDIEFILLVHLIVVYKRERESEDRKKLFEIPAVIIMFVLRWDNLSAREYV